MVLSKQKAKKISANINEFTVLGGHILRVVEIKTFI